MKLLLSLMPALLWSAVNVMVLLNPSDTLPVSAHGTSTILFMTGGIPLFLIILDYLALRTRKMGVFFIIWLPLVLVSFFFILFAAYLLHRDFFTLLFQFVLLFFIQFLVKLPEFCIVKNKRRFFLSLKTAAWGIFIGFSFWTAMMGYAITTRQEPRWIESIVYNMMSCILLVILAGAITIIHQNTRRVLRIENGPLFYLDDRDISDYFTGYQAWLLETFIHHHGTNLTCSMAASHLAQKEVPDCKHCLEQEWSATSCRFYRNLKNQTITLKRFLEILEIGTIIQVAENYREHKVKGWKLRFFDDLILKK